MVKLIDLCKMWKILFLLLKLEVGFFWVVIVYGVVISLMIFVVFIVV